MTEQEITEIEKNYSESKIQHICVAWFRSTFPDIANLLFAVPNGGWRGAKAGAMMQYEGQVRGVADLILLHPGTDNSALCIEMKVPKRKGATAGRQSEHQMAWQRLVESHGGKYVVCHGLIEFAKSICEYLHLSVEYHIKKILDQYPIYR